MTPCGRLADAFRRRWVRALALLAAFALLVAACAQLPPTAATRAAPTAPPTDQARQLTILYTGYGQGEVDPALPPACG